MFKIKNGYSDLCIPFNENQNVMLEILNELIDVGFSVVAVEQIYKHQTVSTKTDSIPIPIPLNELKEKTNGKVDLYNRLTVQYSDPSVTHVMSRSQNAKKFHIIAALPTTESALQHACQVFQGDIITYNSETMKIRLTRKFYYLAVKRNMFFELKYSPVIVDTNLRRATITRGQQYHMIGKSKNIVISSEATDSFHIRNPLGISSLGLIFGLSEEQAKCAISTMSRRVIVAAESRRMGRTPVLMKYEDVDTSTSEEEDECNDDDDDDEESMEVESSPENKKRKISPEITEKKKIKNV